MSSRSNRSVEQLEIYLVPTIFHLLGRSIVRQLVSFLIEKLERKASVDLGASESRHPLNFRHPRHACLYNVANRALALQSGAIDPKLGYIPCRQRVCNRPCVSLAAVAVVQ